MKRWGWGADWPSTLTLREAAELIVFDLYDDDDEDLVLVKASVPTQHLLPPFSRSMLAESDCEDRFTSLEESLLGDPSVVPPIVLLPDGLRDGHHRIALAHEHQLPAIAVYRPAEVSQ